MNTVSVKAMQAFTQRVADEPEFAKAVLENTATAEKEARKISEIPNTPIYLWVVAALSLTLLATVGGAIALVFIDGQAKVPDLLVAMGSGALGALAGIVSPR